MNSQQQVFVMNTHKRREQGSRARVDNVEAARAVASVVRTTLGPRSMLKMLIDPMGGIVITNDGNCILRELDINHPAAKSTIELSRAQDEEVGDGTTSVIVLAGELLTYALPLISSNKIHPTVVCRGLYMALELCMRRCDELAVHVSLLEGDDAKQTLRKVVTSSVGTKFTGQWGDVIIDLALKGISTVCETNPLDPSKKIIDIKKYIKIEKIPGGELAECVCLDGVVLNKDVTHSKMKRRIENPRILLLDCSLEYKKGESQTHVELTSEEDWDKLLRLEEEHVERLCADVLAHKPDIVFTEKGVSDLAQHYFQKAGVTALRRLRKTDNNRLAKATGATIVSRTDEITEADVGTRCGLFEVRKIGDEYFSFIEKCDNPKACSIILRGGSKDVLNEVERNLTDALQVARNVETDARLLPGGGALEMALACMLTQQAKNITSVEQWPVKAASSALEVIPRTLSENCGADVVRVVTRLRALHAEGKHTFGLNGNTGEITDMATDPEGVWDAYSVKTQTIKTAIEASAMLLRVDDVLRSK